MSTRRRSGDARSLQQPVRRHRRADGHHAAQHGHQRERQGAARFQLRAVHARGRPGRQRAAHSGPPGGDGRNGPAASSPTIRDIGRGDVFVTNDPYRGGSHLPDITVVTPVHDTRRPVAVLHGQPGPSRRDGRHHARLDAAVLAQSGRRRGADPQFQADRRRRVALGRVATVAVWPDRIPTRAIDDNLADIAAQVAANHQRRGDLARLVERYSLAVVQAYMRHIQAAAEQKMRQALGAAPRRPLPFIDHLDDGSPDRRHDHDRRRLRPRSTSPAPAQSARAT